ncbi:MAG: hypothetical protein GXO27_00750, partial [Chlorobi bacterium]|nr:hypothetical protein [Chlorobiota bacterium]
MEKEIVQHTLYCPSASDCRACARAGTCDWNGYNKRTVFDVFARIPAPDAGEPFPYVEVRFKNTRKDFYRTQGRGYYVGMPVLVEADKGYDLGVISATGETARLVMRDRNPDLSAIKKVYRPANQKEIDLWQELRAKEEDVKLKAREIARNLGLVMKISDVEYQADGSKVTFYYTAEERVDFRELIKVLAREFSTRIEMRQIGYRQEAARLGGLGSCGRELCCSTWLTDFRSVTTQAAKYQQLALNPSKLTGQCGKLKCCLNFELDAYKEALEAFPPANHVLETEKGEAKAVKVDVFKKMIWYAYTGEESNVLYKLGLHQVNEIRRLNSEGRKSAPLEMYADDLKLEIAPSDGEEKFVDPTGDPITRFDTPARPPRKKKKK